MNTILAWMAFGPGALLCLINFQLSFIGRLLHRLRGLPQETYRQRSGFPLVGSLLVGISLFGLHGVPGVVPAAVVLILIDTGGIHWFVGTLLYRYLQAKKND